MASASLRCGLGLENTRGGRGWRRVPRLRRAADGSELSATFRAEALRTFADDPCHTHTLGAIPECGEWYAAQGRDADADGEGESECASVEERGAADVL